jgi:hypothetical protein
MPDINFIRSEIEYMRRQVQRLRGEIRATSAFRNIEHLSRGFA